MNLYTVLLDDRMIKRSTYLEIAREQGVGQIKLLGAVALGRDEARYAVHEDFA